MKKQILSMALVLCTAVLSSSAQSTALYGGSVLGKNVILGGTDSDIADSLYIGSGPHTIDGTWEIYSTYVQIDPNAVISGSGTIIFYNPSLAFGSSVATLIDANNISSVLDVNVEIQNNQSLILSELPLSAELTSAGWVENTGNNTLSLGRDLNFGVDAGHVVLGNTVQADLVFDNDATVSNYRPNRHVVTNNSILSHVVKQAYTSAFIFPVGIAAGDYTPAQISNTSNNTVSVSVQDYANSASPEALLDGTVNTADGMNRTWHIYANTAGISSTVNLQHNSSTNQTGFVDATHFVTQWGTSTPNSTGDFTIPFSMSPWQTNTQGSGSAGTLSSTGAVAGASLKGRTYASGLANSPLANESYFTKSADAEHPLPLALESFNARANKCSVLLSWNIAEAAQLAHCRLQHSTDGITYTTLNTLDVSDNMGNYSYTHQNPPSGKNLYRLQLVKKNNDYQVSNVVRVDVECLVDRPKIAVYPNPSNDKLTIGGILNFRTTPADCFSIRIINAMGQVMYERMVNKDKEQFDLSELPQATYVVQLLRGQVVLAQEKVVRI